MIRTCRHLVMALALALGVAAPAGAQDTADGIAAFQRGDYGEAVAIWQPLAEAGDPEAQINLAGMYFHGQGVDRDLVLAHKWCDVAAGLLPEGENRLMALRLRAHVALQLSEDERSAAARHAEAWRARAASPQE